MPVNKYKPTSAGRRFMAVSSFEEVTSTTPERSLTVHLKKASGRNNTGRITVRHHGGGHTKLYRVIDFRRTKRDMVARVAAIEKVLAGGKVPADIQPAGKTCLPAGRPATTQEVGKAVCDLI